MIDQSMQTPIEPLSEETFFKFRKLIFEVTNIDMRKGKEILVSNRLRKRVATLRLSSYEEYYHYLTRGSGRDSELPRFIDAVSTNETYFYRETNHLEMLRSVILPELFSRKRRVVIWSAGCSTGEEPYTLRLSFEATTRYDWSGEIDILATDISREVVEKAREGIYRARSLRFVPPDVLRRYFIPSGEDAYRIVDEIKEGVRFGVHNLLKEEPPVPHADVILCRNVMIYFDKETQRRLTDEYFASMLDPQGYLCIGHSESLCGTSRRFRYQRGMNAAVYRLSETAGGVE